jgi:S1/P1 nuclease
MKRLLAVITLCLCLASAAFGWEEKGHKLVADVAAAGLGSNAHAKVQFLLGSQTMAQVAMWADAMRTWQQHPERLLPALLWQDPIAQAFHGDSRNEGQPGWHFTALPIGTTAYQAGSFGTEPDDIVQTIKRCIRVLKHQASSTENLTEQQALRLLIHFVGDIHQPLHTASGYWLRGPGGRAMLAPVAQASMGTKDMGGTRLKFGSGRADNLHGLWDGPMVDEAQKSRTYGEYLQTLIGLACGSRSAPWTLAGDPLTWPERWASDSATIAIQAYQEVGTNGLGLDDSRHLNSLIVIPPTYVARFTDTVNLQLARGGFRLAAVLNSIWP